MLDMSAAGVGAEAQVTEEAGDEIKSLALSARVLERERSWQRRWGSSFGRAGAAAEAECVRPAEQQAILGSASL
jgi:hypothetical protein